jgi:Fuc2NAc and GlcNAc transferase
MIILFLSFAIGCLGAWIVYIWGYQIGLADLPNERSSHCKPVPKGGGIGILVTVILSSVALKIPWLVWMPVTVVSIFSFVGDARELSFQSRLAVQTLAAAIISLMTWPGMPLLRPGTGITPLAILLGILVVCTSGNIYNFMDGIDGLAAILGIDAFIFLGAYGLAGGRSENWSLWAFCIAAACLGFLPLNFPKAKVFMGDVGSVLLGFLFACFLLKFSQSAIDVIVIASFLFPFFMDELNTVLIRIRSRERLTKPHRRHIYQILVNQRGLSHSRVSLYYGFVQILVGFSTCLISRSGLLMAIAFTFMCYITAGLWANSVRRQWEGVRA